MDYIVERYIHHLADSNNTTNTNTINITVNVLTDTPPIAPYIQYITYNIYKNSSDWNKKHQHTLLHASTNSSSNGKKRKHSLDSSNNNSNNNSVVALARAVIV